MSNDSTGFAERLGALLEILIAVSMFLYIVMGGVVGWYAYDNCIKTCKRHVPDIQGKVEWVSAFWPYYWYRHHKYNEWPNFDYRPGIDD